MFSASTAGETRHRVEQAIERARRRPRKACPCCYVNIEWTDKNGERWTAPIKHDRECLVKYHGLSDTQLGDRAE